MEYETWTTERNGVTLVAVRLQNDEAAPCRVRVTNELDGAVWPPRTNGVPDAGWNDAGYTGVVAADGTLALGYATPGRPETPAVTVTETPTEDPDSNSDSLDPVRGLPDPRPPRDALPASVPPEVDSWLDDVERRVERGAADERERALLAQAARLHARCHQ